MTRNFPLELLQQPQASRLAYFDNYTMAHPHLEAAATALKRIVRHPGESRVIFIYGPTGVGKTTLRLLVEKWLIEQSLSSEFTDWGRIPVASVEAVVQKSGLFNSKDHIKRCLYALHEPKQLVDHKIDYGVRGIYRHQFGQIVIESKVIETELGWALEQALRHRRPGIFFIDEAHHMLMVASGRKLTDLPEAIKSLASRTEVVHGLLGTYELLMLHDVGDQLSRRSVYIHLPRYRAECTADREIFQSVVWNFQSHLPLEEEPDLLSHWDYCYERSLGCVGVLKNWFRNALADALDERATTVTLKHLQQRALSVAQCLNILKKIKEGENKHAEIEASVEQLRTELGLGVEPSIKGNLTSALAPPDVAPKSRRHSRHVAKPKPKRRQVGVEPNAG